MNFQKQFDFFILFIIFIKIFFITFAIAHILLTYSHNAYINKFNKYDPQLVYWKERTEFIFNISMAILLIYFFRPNKMIPINRESGLMLYFFGWTVLLTAKWTLFFHEATWYEKIVKLFF
jgi:hypothetical protein